MTDDHETRLLSHFDGMARQPLPPALENRLLGATWREPARRLWLNISVGVATAAALWKFLSAGAPCEPPGVTDAGCLLVQTPAEHAVSGAWGPVRYVGTQMKFSVVYDTPPHFGVSSCAGTTSTFTISSGGQAGRSLVRLTPAPGSCISSTIELHPRGS